MDWSKSIGKFVPPRGTPQPAVLLNHRLCFPAFDDFWKGGVADAVPEIGKSISGALFKVKASTLRLLDLMAGRKQSEYGDEQGIRQRPLLEVKPYNSNQTIRANVYRLVNSEPVHVPPTELYLQRMADAAWQTGLSAMWIMHLHSFASRGSRPQGLKRPHIIASPDRTEIAVHRKSFGILPKPALAPSLKTQFPNLSISKLEERKQLIFPVNCLVT